jgi:coproporphyrinogen III oxidase
MLYKTETRTFRDRWIAHIYALQDRICRALELADGQAVFVEDEWERKGGGGGNSRSLNGGRVFEKGGVNTSVVFGKVTEQMKKLLPVQEGKWFACGLSIVIHPLNPYVPTIHANWRYFELYNEEGFVTDRWFGGGTDLTPYYLFEEDARHFHGTLKNAVDPFGEGLYDEYRQACDEYFVNRHRSNEMRGIGGIFYDQLKPVDEEDLERLFRFQQAMGDAFLPAYLPIVEKRKDIAYGERETEWQEIRRGRYVEFNLIHDRGTLFGLKTNGRTESILMSLPPRARWVYDHRPLPGSEEEKLLQACLNPKKWV